MSRLKKFFYFVARNEDVVILVLALLVLLVVFINPVRADDYYIKWESIEKADGYKIYVTDESKETEIKDVKNVNKYALKDLEIIPGKNYSYRVAAYNKHGQGPKSQAINYILSADGTPERINLIMITN